MRNRTRIARLSMACLVAGALALGAATARGDEFYTLASAQTVTVRGGSAVRLTANGPIAFDRQPDPDAPPGVQRVRLRLYGVESAAGAVLGPVEGASVTATPDGRGNLNVIVTAAVPLDPARPFEVRTGTGPNEVDIVLRAP